MRESFTHEMQAKLMLVSLIKYTIMAPFGLLTFFLALLENSLHGLLIPQSIMVHIISVHTTNKNA